MYSMFDFVSLLLLLAIAWCACGLAKEAVKVYRNRKRESAKQFADNTADGSIAEHHSVGN